MVSAQKSSKNHVIPFKDFLSENRISLSFVISKAHVIEFIFAFNLQRDLCNVIVKYQKKSLNKTQKKRSKQTINGIQYEFKSNKKAPWQGHEYAWGKHNM